MRQGKVKQNVTMLLVMVVGVCLLTALVSVRSWYQPTVKLNEYSPVTIILDKDAEVVDRVATDEAKDKARLTAIKNVGHREILKVDNKVREMNLKSLKFLVHIVRESITNSQAHPDPLNPKISLKTQDHLMSLDDERYSQVVLSTDVSEIIKDQTIADELSSLVDVERKFFFDGLTKIREHRNRMEEEMQALGASFMEVIKREDYEHIFVMAFDVQKKLLDLGIVSGLSRKKIHDNIRILYPHISYTRRALIQRLIDRSTIPNIEIDWNAVNELEQSAMKAVKPVTVELKQGSLLASKGKLVEPQNYYYLSELNMLHAQTDWKEILNNFYLIAISVLIISVLIAVTKFKQYSIQQVIMIFMVPVVVSAIIAAIAAWGVNKLALAPLATVSILLTIFYAPTMAAVVVSFMCFFMAKTVDMDFWQVLPHLVGSIYAIFLVRRAHQREDLTNAGTKIAIAQVLVFLLTIMVAVEEFEVITVLIVAGLYTLSAVGSGFLSLAALPYLESGLKLLTPFKLAELSNPNQALLKKLKEEAPGTYQHSLNVSRLSEEAGNMLGLNTELIRVGLLYHDIGKMHAPDYFIENALGKPNPHTTLDDPQKSAEIIIAHVPEGIKLAKKYNLPQAIVDFIPMHQGSTITNYFYHAAMEKYGEVNVDPEDYRYPGPIPNTKETGVAMIADSSEAALRSMKDLDSEDKAREMIYKIINARLEEGELAESGLNRAELDKVAAAFLEVWRSWNHERVKYPEAQAKS